MTYDKTQRRTKGWPAVTGIEMALIWAGVMVAVIVAHRVGVGIPTWGSMLILAIAAAACWLFAHKSPLRW